MLRSGTPLASRVVHEVTGHFSSCMWFFRMMHRCVSAPSGCDFIHRVVIKEVYGYQVLLKSGPRNRGLPNVAPTTRLRLEFPRETGLILRCAGKVGNPFQTKQGNRPPVAIRKGEGAQMK